MPHYVLGHGNIMRGHGNIHASFIQKWASGDKVTEMHFFVYVAKENQLFFASLLLVTEKI